jgi:predicted nucleic acid-binding protein
VIYIDTGPFVARYLRRDQYHQLALKAWKYLDQQPWRCYTSSFVLAETFTLLARRASYQFAVQRARSILMSAELEIPQPTFEDELKAVSFFEKFADQSVSFVDCISFVLMQKKKIRRAFSFDRHFSLAGFKCWPEEVKLV